MQHPIIAVRQISKQYTLTHRLPYGTFRDTVVEAAKKTLRRSTAARRVARESFWALHDVSFSVEEGQKLGIIGRNGAGKSTLLKILSQITPPTAGEAILRGRVASLLEVGTGFHPELTGRENIFLNGALLGMTQREIKRKFDDIIAFAEIEQFLDMPVKHYSSGMYVRLAFAVAAHLEPEILIVDEVLAVGDTQFQKKCLGKMQEVAQGGRTVLFVSHNLAAVKQLCERCLLLVNGKIVANGNTNTVVDQYLAQQVPTAAIFLQDPNPTKKMHLRKVQLNPGKPSTNIVQYDENVTIRIEYEVHRPVKDGCVWVSLQTPEGIVPLCTADYDMHQEQRGVRTPGYYQTDLLIPKKTLAPGVYDVLVGVSTNTVPAEVFDRIETIRFEVLDNGTSPRSLGHESSRSGIFQPFLDWQTTVIRRKSPE